ncbi:MAG: hypothetical protein QM534_10245 [Sediminibacterium sp.]|nr:hypothetical protein [Sediminibacterium sp.]
MDSKQPNWLWAGKMMDCNGRVSRFYMNDAAGQEKAEFLIEILERDGHATSIKGALSFKYDEQKHLQLSYKSESQKATNGNLSWMARLKPASPGIYAKASVFGTYETESADSVLSNGVIVLWQFK